MKRGFTIIELLVASALLGLLTTILTMVFNQSSIAWRIGIAGASDLGDIRYAVGSLREVADNAFVYGNIKGQVIGLWDLNGEFDKRDRACITVDKVESVSGQGDSEMYQTMNWFFNKTGFNRQKKGQNIAPVSVGSGDSGGSFNTYSVNVMSGGPANDIEDWQAIWSYPDDPNQW